MRRHPADIARIGRVVSIHAPTRGATKPIRLPVNLIIVSIHAPTRGATCVSRLLDLTKMFQSTHPHGVRRNSAVPKATLIYVSIHAPTRGATQGGGNFDFEVRVSIHAPTRGATRCRYLAR